ncbi:cobalamin B12-binding domain-containing protein [Limnohabitans sp.]|uniref:cobalamin B12-binding domain-containing protein n=1 Tax=Limnohabitans sp. TaxID=1907725 RepID=UPI002AFF2631|nr:cobalamin B12-binding domain-containing protein [Limnohabitans sp.]
MSEFSASGGQAGGVKRAASLQDDCKDSLLAVIEEQIIPRLLNVQQFFPGKATNSAEEILGAEQPEFEAFTQHCLKGDAVKANQIVDSLTARGLAHDRIFLELITPAARHLGALWEQDLCDFTQVTCGLAMMHQMIYRLGYESPAGQNREGASERVMLACAPGSQHFLGLTIVADFFRQAGSEVVLEISSSESELLRAVANEWFDVVGISVALEAQLQTLPDLIAHLRASSGNPQVRVVLGGPIFLIHDFSPDNLGADAIFTDAREAVGAVQRLVRAR